MIRRFLSHLPGLSRIFGDPIDTGPIDSVDTLAHFVRTRSSFIAQTSLYGYLKERMGTRYSDIFQDDRFSGIIKQASIKLFASCVGDLAVFAVATAARDAELETPQLENLARHCFDVSLAEGLTADDRLHVPEDAAHRFEERLSTTDWAGSTGEAVFAGSIEALVTYAPVIDDYKKRDREIVSNSIRFRWNDVRDQIRDRAVGDAIFQDWLESGGARANLNRI